MAERRVAQVDEVFAGLRRAVRRYGFLFDSRSTYVGVWQTVHALQARHAYLAYRLPPARLRKWRATATYPTIAEDSLTGNEADGIPQLTAEQNAELRGVLFGDVCPLVTRLKPKSSLYTTPTLAECRSLYGGVMTTGLQYAMQRYLEIAAAVMDTVERTVVPITSLNGTGFIYNRPATVVDLTTTFSPSDAAWVNATTSPYVMPDMLGGGLMREAEELDMRYLEPLTQHMTDMYKTRLEQQVANYRLFLIAWITLGVLAITGGIAGVFLPAIHAMDRDLHNKRALLLLLPPQTMLHVPSLRALVEQMLVAGHVAVARNADTTRRSGRPSDAGGAGADEGGEV
jgi:hypothetical protein